MLFSPPVFLAAEMLEKKCLQAVTRSANPALCDEHHGPHVARAVHLEGRMYPVEPFFLEEALSWTAFRADARSGSGPLLRLFGKWAAVKHRLPGI